MISVSSAAQKEYARDHYASNREKRIAQAGVYQKEHPEHRSNFYRRRKAEVNAYKLYQGCVRCGYCESAAALTFHHRDTSTKASNVAGLVGSSRAVLDAEIAKCDVICANCHAIEHYEEDF